MYIRDAQGQLRWIPPQLVATATPIAHRQAIQNNLRNQIQREEWNRFNAPPPEDNIYFHDPHQHYTGPPSLYNSNKSSIENAPMIANHGNLLYQGHAPVDPPIPRVIHSTPFQRHPRSRSTPITPYLGSSEGFSKTRSMEFNDMKTVEEEYHTAANIDCMNTLFGSAAIMPNNGISLARNTGLIHCNRLNISTDEVEFDDPTPSNFVQPEITNNIQCNGIRGPGKKFNYSYDKESDHIKAHEEFLHIVSETKRRKTPCATPTPKNIISQNTSELNADERQGGYVGSSKSPQIHNALHMVLTSGRTNRKEVYPLEDVISSHDSYEKLSYIVDTISVAKNQIPQGIDIIVKKIMTMKMEENDMSDNFKKRSDASSAEDVEEKYSKPRHQNMDRIETRYGAQDNKRITGTNFTIKDQAELEENVNNICLNKIGSAGHNISNEDYPSFDEPEPTTELELKPEPELEPDVNRTEINAQHSNSSTCTLSTSSIGRENRQKESNCFPQVENMSSVKHRGNRKKIEHFTKMHMEHNITTENSKMGHRLVVQNASLLNHILLKAIG